MNKIVLMGRLTKDCDVRYTNAGKVVAQFILAVDRPYKDAEGKKEADFITVVLWGNAAEFIANNVSKGKRVLVEGRLQIRSYDDKDGKRVYVAEVVANNVTPIDWNNKDDMNTNKAEPMQSFGQAFGDEEIPF